MKVFLDANILVSVVNRELPLFNYSSRVLSLTDIDSRYKLFTSPTCLAIAFYFACKRCSEEKALRKIQILSKRLEITTMGPKEVFATNSNKKVTDYEDGLQYYSAIHAGCDTIITENKDDFYYSKIPVYDSKQFILEIL